MGSMKYKDSGEKWESRMHKGRLRDFAIYNSLPSRRPAQYKINQQQHHVTLTIIALKKRRLLTKYVLGATKAVGVSVPLS